VKGYKTFSLFSKTRYSNIGVLGGSPANKSQGVINGNDRQSFRATAREFNTYISKVDKKKDAGLSQQRPPRKPHIGARVALLHCPILRMSKALVLCPRNAHGKQAYTDYADYLVLRLGQGE